MKIYTEQKKSKSRKERVGRHTLLRNRINKKCIKEQKKRKQNEREQNGSPEQTAIKLKPKVHNFCCPHPNRLRFASRFQGDRVSLQRSYSSCTLAFAIAWGCSTLCSLFCRDAKTQEGRVDRETLKKRDTYLHPHVLCPATTMGSKANAKNLFLV